MSVLDKNGAAIRWRRHISTALDLRLSLQGAEDAICPRADRIVSEN
jgi:hypothetical protein